MSLPSKIRWAKKVKQKQRLVKKKRSQFAIEYFAVAGAAVQRRMQKMKKIMKQTCQSLKKKLLRDCKNLKKERKIKIREMLKRKMKSICKKKGSNLKNQMKKEWN